MRYYEILDESPYVQALSMYAHSSPQIGVCSMPKRFLDHKSCEVMRFFKLHNKGFVEPIQMIVPRKVVCVYVLFFVIIIIISVLFVIMLNLI